MKISQLAEEVRNFLLFHRTCVLGTLDREDPSFPFTSLLHYDIDHHGNIIICISPLAEHYKNIAAHPNVSALIFAKQCVNDPLVHPRATVLAHARALVGAEDDQARMSFFARFPSAIDSSVAETFKTFVLAPNRIRWIGGFARAHWVAQEAYHNVGHDPIAYLGQDLAKKIESEQQNVLQELVKAKGRVLVTLLSSKCIDVTDESSGMSTRVTFSITPSSPGEFVQVLKDKAQPE